MNVFTYTAKEINKIQLQAEIEQQVKSFALDKIEIVGDLIITFKGDIPQEEQTLLTNVVLAHVPEESAEVPQVVQLSNRSSTDDVPYVYPTSLPKGWYVVFQGAGDTEPTADSNGVGKGGKFSFNIKSTDTKISKDFTFNEDIFLKDAYLICKNAPFGATIDLEIVHPVAGLLLQSGVAIPIFGDSFTPLNTDRRAFLPKGLILRMTVSNSKGGLNGGGNESTYEDPPSTFFVSGRLEIMKKKPAGVP